LYNTVYISLGSNIGSKIDNINTAVDKIKLIENITITNYSSLYLTKPWGYLEQDYFINQVVELKTDLSPLKLLHELQDIEIKMGRKRTKKWGPRIIDIDILLYGEKVVRCEELIIPHPHMRERLFVLIPLQEINSELVLPDGTYIKEVLSRVLVREGTQGIKKL